MKKEELRYPDIKDQIFIKDGQAPNQQEVVEGYWPAPVLSVLSLSPIQRGLKGRQGKSGKRWKRTHQVAKDTLQAVRVISSHSGTSLHCEV